MPGEEIVTASGVVMFYWDSGDDLIINIEPDDHHKPDVFELIGDLRAGAIEQIEEGLRVEVDYRVEHHEVVDPDGLATLDRSRAKPVAVRFGPAG